MTVPEPTPAACRARRRGPHKPPLPAWALRDLRNRGHAALTLAARADLKAGAGTEQTVTVPPPKSASTTPPAFASALRPGKSPGRRLRRGRLRPWPAGPGIPGRPGPAPCTQPIWPRRRSRPGVPQSCSSSTGSRTTVEDHITGQPKIRQSSRSAVPSGELHPTGMRLTSMTLTRSTSSVQSVTTRRSEVASTSARGISLAGTSSASCSRNSSLQLPESRLTVTFRSR